MDAKAALEDYYMTFGSSYIGVATTWEDFVEIGIWIIGYATNFNFMKNKI